MRWATGKRPDPDPNEVAWCKRFAWLPRHCEDKHWVWLETYLEKRRYVYSFAWGVYRWRLENKYSQESRQWYDHVLTEEEKKTSDFVRETVEELNNE